MESIRLRAPDENDGAAVHRLVKRCPPLDRNSRYCNLLQVTHFRDTSIVAEANGRLVGFVTGYRVPSREHVLFIWQVGVCPEGRGRGLAGKMLRSLIARTPGVTHLETTVTPSNDASRSTFQSFADDAGAPIVDTPMFTRERHFDGAHEDEVMLRIGPLEPNASHERAISDRFDRH